MVQLTQEQIKKNKQIFLQLNEKYGILPKELLDFLGEGFFTAPASVATNLHNACEGGLVDHILTTAKYAKKINDLLVDTPLQQPALSVYRVSFLFDIGKTFMYVPNQEEWSRKKGKMFDFSEGTVAMRVGERSAFYATQYMKLTEDEYQAIINADREELDAQVKWFGSTLTTILRQSIEWSIMEQKKRT
jgi:hypothetical protein